MSIGEDDGRVLVKRDVAKLAGMLLLSSLLVVWPRSVSLAVAPPEVSARRLMSHVR